MPLDQSEEIQNAKSFLEANLPQDTAIVPHVTEIGEVIYVGDGICKVKGLPNARIDDMIKIEANGEDVYALILGLNQDIVESVVLGDFTKIAKGNLVKSSRRRVTIPVGEAVLGRVINPLGKPLDGKGEIPNHKSVPVEVPAPAVNEREQITDQVRTGVLVVDSIIPVGKGQRELVVGDRKTGKTTLMINLINNQKGKGNYCIYVSIGGKKAKIKGIVEALEKSGALEYTVVILATADDPPSLNYIAPYAGCAIAENFMRNGKDAIVIYDDLSKQAKAYRQMSLLLKRSPGRDAYPGDIFFLHSRLLERSARVAKEFGGGSSTAFPMAETQAGDISEYITTNLMSITDGHIYLDSNLLHAGILPAVDSGFSVSRIGGSIQTKMLRKLSELAASQLQRYNEVKSYENINTEITEETEREIKRGKRILEIFNQPSSVCLSLEEEVLYLYVVTQGKIDDMELPDVKKLKKELLALIRDEKNIELRNLLGRKDLSIEDTYDTMDAIFTPDFLASLVSVGMKEDVDQLIKKELNKTGLGAPAPTLSSKGTTTIGAKRDNSIALETGELDAKFVQKPDVEQSDSTNEITANPEGDISENKSENQIENQPENTEAADTQNVETQKEEPTENLENQETETVNENKSNENNVEKDEIKPEEENKENVESEQEVVNDETPAPLPAEEAVEETSLINPASEESINNEEKGEENLENIEEENAQTESNIIKETEDEKPKEKTDESLAENTNEENKEEVLPQQETEEKEVDTRESDKEVKENKTSFKEVSLLDAMPRHIVEEEKPKSKKKTTKSSKKKAPITEDNLGKVINDIKDDDPPIKQIDI